MIAWVDNSPEALRRQDAIRKKERQDRGDEEREQRLIAEQVERARQDAEEKGAADGEEGGELVREEGERITLNFRARADEEKPPADGPAADGETGDGPPSEEGAAAEGAPAAPEKVAVRLGGAGRPKNVFAAVAKKNALAAGAKPAVRTAPPRPMSEAERIMKEEIERKRALEAAGLSGPGSKRQKV
jgi:DNA/RNA-binding protein KIN17